MFVGDHIWFAGALDQARWTVIGTYRDAGYPFATAKMEQLRLSPNADRIEVLFRVKRGARFKQGKV